MSAVDNFCSNCGQVNDTKPLSIKQYLTEFLSGFFSFDTRTINTIIPLLFKPGKVTNEYIHGERMKYVNPFQLYLHTSIIFFLVTGIFSSIDSYKKIINTTVDKKVATQKADSISKLIINDLQKNNFDVITAISKPIKDSLKIDVKKLIIQKSDSLFFNKKFIKTVNNKLLNLKEKDKIIDSLINIRTSELYSDLSKNKYFKNDSLKDYYKFKNVLISNLEEKLDINKLDYKVSELAKIQTQENDELIINNLLGNSFYKKYLKFKNCKTKDVGIALDSLGYKRTRTNIFYFKKTKEFEKLTKDKTSRRAYFKNYLAKIPIVLFFMLPILALFLKLIYIRNKTNFTEHLVFIFHVQTFFFLNLLLALSLDRVFKIDVFLGISFLIFIIYLYVALKKYYKQHWFKTFVKFVLLNTAFFILSILGVIVVGLLAFAL
jgi:hypothetical protein